MPDRPTTPDGSLLFVGNATTIIEHSGFRVLTDPNFLHRGQRAYLGYGLTSRRRTDPALTVDRLPPLDAVVLSHLHGDHWDRVAARGLDHDLPVLTTPHASKRLQLRGFARAVGLRTWTSHVLRRDGRQLRVTALPGRHAPGVVQALFPPVMGSLLEFGPEGDEPDLRLYISGDTLFYDGLREVARRHPALDVAVLHLGGTTVLGRLVVTMDGRQGADLLELLRPPQAVPVHHDDYEAFRSPLSDFLDEAARRGLGDRVVTVERGGRVALAGSRRRA